jgi:predicted transport protein
MVDKMMQSIEEKYGKPFGHWVELLLKSGLQKHGEMLNLLKSEHGFSHGFANLVAHKARASDSDSASSTDSLINTQYAKGKEELRSIYDILITKISKFGKDVEVAPKKAYVSLRRSKQFAIIQPSTKTRIDVGINLKGKEPTDKLEASGSFNAMVSHRVRITESKQIDEELLSWLKEAYENA